MPNAAPDLRCAAITSLLALVACAVPIDPPEEETGSQSVKGAQWVDAAIVGAGGFAGHTYLFRGGKYRRLNTSVVPNVFDDAGSLPVFAFHLPAAYHNGVDAALAGVGSYSNWGYFFSGPNFASYNWSLNLVDSTGTLGANWHLPAP